MYRLTDQQIDFILDDIRARGVTMESLQHDLLDHVCCIVEQKLDAGGDFRRFYESVITTFYKKELREIEEETYTLLNNKQYYAMKKIMLISGIVSACLLTAGIILKFLHASGASIGIVLGTGLFSFLFLPLMVTLRVKEKKERRDKLLAVTGTLAAMLISIGIMFKIMYWPYANMLGMLSVAVLFLVYLPINLVTGIRNPDAKVNTVVSSVLLVAGCGLFMSLVRSPQGSKAQYIHNTKDHLIYERILENERLQRTTDIPARGNAIIQLCDELKSFIIEKETGSGRINENFEETGSWLGDTNVHVYFPESSQAFSKYRQLEEQINAFNSTVGSAYLPDAPDFRGKNGGKVVDALNSLVRIQLLVLQYNHATVKE